MNSPSSCRDGSSESGRETLEIERLLTEDQRETKRVSVQAHADFREHCRDVLAEIARIEREADLLTQLNTSKS